MKFVLQTLWHPGRERLEQYISGIFNAAYEARILEYLPLLFQLESSGTRQAALGLRAQGVDWGRYYEGDPVVMLADSIRIYLRSGVR